ncbi:MAG: ABC transporter permease [Halanaerobiales bacterium]|nr:ABC transporter permease [Halanaerobiales bacterium]
MKQIIIKRLIIGLFVILVVTMLTFALLQLFPGDPAKMIAPWAGEETLIEIRKSFGLDSPFHIQVLKFYQDALKGDFGESFFYREEVRTLLFSYFPRTIYLTLGALLMALVISIPLGVLSALNRDSFIDRIVLFISITSQSLPNFWLALMFILFFAVKLGLFPAGGYGSWQHLFLPSFALACTLIATFIRSIRSMMIDVLEQDFIKASEARGIPRLYIIKKGLRNTFVPLLTLFTMQLGYMLGGAVVIEFIFNYPGIGLLAMQAVLRRDYPLIQGLVVLISTVFIILNLLVDLSYTYLDPRIRKEEL